jgi:ATP-dependent RNA helicase DDX18/HAS1
VIVCVLLTLLFKNSLCTPLQDIHGKQKQQRRTTTFFEFCSAEKGILLCTDVAARGLDIPGRVRRSIS